MGFECCHCQKTFTFNYSGRERTQQPSSMKWDVAFLRFNFVTCSFSCWLLPLALLIRYLSLEDKGSFCILQLLVHSGKLSANLDLQEVSVHLLAWSSPRKWWCSAFQMSHGYHACRGHTCACLRRSGGQICRLAPMCLRSRWLVFFQLTASQWLAQLRSWQRPMMGGGQSLLSNAGFLQPWLQWLGLPGTSSPCVPFVLLRPRPDFMSSEMQLACWFHEYLTSHNHPAKKRMEQLQTKDHV